MTTFPSQYRDGADHLWTALSGDKTQALKDIVAVSGLDRKTAQLGLSLAKAGTVADGTNGRWARGDVSRTTFRDGIVLGLLRSQAGKQVTMATIVADLAGLASASQVYGSLARLQAKSWVTASRDGTRSPLYIIA